MNDKMNFFLFLIERYSSFKNRATGEIFREWDKHGITQTIYDNYWLYHCEAIENAFADIDSLLTTEKPAW